RKDGGVFAIALVLVALLDFRNCATAESLFWRMGLLSMSLGLRFSSHKHHRSVPRTISLPILNGRIYLAAIGSAIISSYSSGSIIKLPPSLGMLPITAGEMRGDNGNRVFSMSTFEPSTRYALMPRSTGTSTGCWFT